MLQEISVHDLKIIVGSCSCHFGGMHSTGPHTAIISEHGCFRYCCQQEGSYTFKFHSYKHKNCYESFGDLQIEGYFAGGMSFS